MTGPCADQPSDVTAPRNDFARLVTGAGISEGVLSATQIWIAAAACLYQLA